MKMDERKAMNVEINDGGGSGGGCVVRTAKQCAATASQGNWDRFIGSCADRQRICKADTISRQMRYLLEPPAKERLWS